MRTALSICLASRHPICILWGPDHLYLYNDAYAPIVGAKHPAANGALYPDVWPEIWESDIKPVLQGVLSSGEASWADNLLLVLQRHGYNEECYFSFSFAPIRDESGGVGGVFTAITETTAHVVGERRLRTLSELGARATDGKTPMDACRIAAEVLERNPHDIPFALFYLLGEKGGAQLAAEVGIGADHRARSPDRWCLDEVRESGRPIVLRDLSERFGALPGGPWPEPTHTAMVLPIARPGQSQPYGFLVSGISPGRAIDPDYESFLSLVADQVGNAVSNAVAHEEERRRAEALAELDRAKTLFFSNVSHEFRTPLTLILGPLEDLLADPDHTLASAQRSSLEAIHRNSLRLLKLVNTLLDFSRIEAGRAQATYEPTDLATLTRDLASTFRSAMEKAGLELIIECAPLREPVYVDREMWEKIVLNLLSNAFKFTFEGRVKVELTQVDDRVELSVEDTGIGIPENELPHLFERFHRVQGARSRTHEGTGIGLALVRELVKLHGGDIRVESELDRGSRFVLSIPLGRDHLPQDRIGTRRPLASTALRAETFVAEALRWLPESEQEKETPANIPERARILVADDNADMRDYVERLLRDRWEVSTATDGRAALELVRTERPQVVLADVMMPNLDGFGLLRAIRTDADLSSTPVILLSARAGEESRIEGLEAGADDYVIKPFSARELIARVETQLMRSRLRTVEESLNRRLASVFRHAPVGLAVLRGPEHVFEFVNSAYLEIVSHREVFGLPVRQALAEFAGQGVFERLDEVFASGEPHIGESVGLMMKGPSDDEVRERFFNLVYQPLFEDGAVRGIAVVVNDVTPLAIARREAEQANRAKDEFLAMLGHELRNPLAPIVTALHVMKLRNVSEGAKEREVIERQVRHLTRLVDDLLDVARITGGKVALQQEHCELAELVTKAIELSSPLLEQRRHELSVSVPSRGLVVNADRTRVAQIISNLMTNAAKYTEPGGRIELVARCEGREVVLEVRDNGVGIAPPMLKKIFDLFVQARSGDRTEGGGLGLGLAIAKNLTLLHGGRLTARSEGIGRGSTFELRLPAVLPLSSGKRPERRTSSSPLEVARAGNRILIVDDNEDSASMLASALRVVGHTVRVAHDGPSALDELSHFTPEIAVLDLGLPVMDGFELARTMRKRPELRRIGLVALTGYSQEADKRRTHEAGFDAHLVKPCDIDVLSRLIGDLTQRNSNGKIST